MIRINLLPYREARRTRQARLLWAAALGILLIAGVFYYGIYEIFVHRVQVEEARVNYLQGVKTQLDEKIASIAKLREERERLTARVDVIRNLQDHRDLVVRVFNELAAITPKGIFLTHAQQQGDGLTVNGYAESNSQVAGFMRNIEASRLLDKPLLQIISKTQLGNEEVGQFTMQMGFRPTGETNSTMGASGDEAGGHP